MFAEMSLRAERSEAWQSRTICASQLGIASSELRSSSQ